MSQPQAEVCLVRIDRIIAAVPPDPSNVAIDLRRIKDNHIIFHCSGMVLPLAYLARLIGRYPEVGAAYQIVTTPGQWE